MRAAWVKRLALVLLVGLVALVVPDGSPAPAEVSLVKIRRATGVAPGVGNGEVIWILAVGSDARPGQSMTRSHGDALQLVGINTRTHAATAIGIPRDSYVAIRGYGRSKINAALVFGGPPLMARAVGDLVGIQPDYVMVTRFKFFENMINEIGGITVSNPRPFADPYLKKEGFRSGRIKLGGYDAMAFSRIRKSLAGGDLDRSANQQRTLRGILGTIRARRSEPGFIERGVLTVLRHTSTDLGPTELFEVAQAVAQVEPSKVTTCVVQGGVGYVGEASVVFPNVAMARRLGREARRDATLRC